MYAPSASATPCRAWPVQACDVAAVLAAERGRRLSVTAVELRRAAIRYLHYLAECPVRPPRPQASETMAGMRRAAGDAGDIPAKKLAATVSILRQILAPIEDDLRGRRDRALKHWLGFDAIDPGTVAWIIQRRARIVGFDPKTLGGHSLRRGALTVGMERGVHPTLLKRMGRHISNAVLNEYLE